MQVRRCGFRRLDLELRGTHNARFLVFIDQLKCCEHICRWRLMIIKLVRIFSMSRMSTAGRNAYRLMTISKCFDRFTLGCWASTGSRAQRLLERRLKGCYIPQFEMLSKPSCPARVMINVLRRSDLKKDGPRVVFLGLPFAAARAFAGALAKDLNAILVIPSA